MAKSWSEILTEIQGTPQQGSASGFDIVRRRYLASLNAYTGRPTIVYATAFLDANKASLADVSIHPGDKEGFSSVTRDLPDGPLDVILHSPGGTAEGAEGIVNLLRPRFSDIRFIVPIAAKSAATMLALAGHSVVMDDTSELGPIDPQRVFRRVVGAMSEVVVSPVMAIKEMWERIDDETTKDPSKLAKWYPIISQFGPSLLVECDLALDLAQSLVSKWLETGMLAGRANGHEDALRIAAHLANHANFGSHARALGIDEAMTLGLEVVDLRDPGSADLRGHMWEAWHATSITLANTGATKLFENHLGQAQVTSVSVQQQIVPAAPPAGPAAPPRRPADPQPSRAERRANERAAKKRR